MSNKRVLTDFAGFTKFDISENAGGKTIIRGEFGRADVPTANKRVYPRSLWEREIKNIKQAMSEGKVFGHLNHPADGKTNLKEVALVMRNLWMEPDGTVMGEAVICDNEHGNQFKSIKNAGGQVGVSSRGMGSTRMGEGKYAGSEVVDDDYEYMTHDLVADPAVVTSYPKVTVEDENKTGNLTETDAAVTVESNEEEVVKTYTEDEVKAKLDAKEKEMKEAHAKLTEKEELPAEEIPVEELPPEAAPETPAEEEEENEAMAQAVELAKKIQDLIAPLVPGAEAQAVENLEHMKEEIKNLKAQLESKDKEIAETVAEAKQLAESTRRIAMTLTLEKELSSCLQKSDQKSLAEHVGDLKKYTTMETLAEAIKIGKKKIVETNQSKLAEEKKLKQMQESHQAEVAKLKADLEKKNKQIEEALKKEALKTAQLYVESVVRGNPNAQKIRKICEGKTDKREIDGIVKEYAIASADAGDYNYIQQRISRLDEAKKNSTTIVENQLSKANGSDKKVQVEGVDAEIADVGGM